MPFSTMKMYSLSGFYVFSLVLNQVMIHNLLSLSQQKNSTCWSLEIEKVFEISTGWGIILF